MNLNDHPDLILGNIQYQNTSINNEEEYISNIVALERKAVQVVKKSKAHEAAKFLFELIEEDVKRRNTGDSIIINSNVNTTKIAGRVKSTLLPFLIVTICIGMILIIWYMYGSDKFYFYKAQWSIEVYIFLLVLLIILLISILVQIKEEFSQKIIDSLIPAEAMGLEKYFKEALKELLTKYSKELNERLDDITYFVDTGDTYQGMIRLTDVIDGKTLKSIIEDIILIRKDYNSHIIRKVNNIDLLSFRGTMAWFINIIVSSLIVLVVFIIELISKKKYYHNVFDIRHKSALEFSKKLQNPISELSKELTKSTQELDYFKDDLKLFIQTLENHKVNEGSQIYLRLAILVIVIIYILATSLQYMTINKERIPLETSSLEELLTREDKIPIENIEDAFKPFQKQIKERLLVLKTIQSNGNPSQHKIFLSMLITSLSILIFLLVLLFSKNFRNLIMTEQKKMFYFIITLVYLIFLVSSITSLILTLIYTFTIGRL
jgi:hypothetical protein